MPLPDFIIAGAQKSGTTTLHKTLAVHPQIHFPKTPQEIHFFDDENNYSKGMVWYEQLFSSAGRNQIVGQTSPMYTYYPMAVTRIQSQLPRVKILIILRNPIDRAYSHYWHSLRYGYEHLDFAAALNMENKRLSVSKFSQRHHSYVDRGMYSNQINRFHDAFGERNVLILTQDALKLQFRTTLKKCCDFLCVDNGFYNNFTLERVHNSSKIPRFTILQRARPVFERLNLPLAAKGIDKINLRECRYPPMSDLVRKRLQSVFAEESASLLSMLPLESDHIRNWD